MSAFLRVSSDANDLAMVLREVITALERSAPAEPGVGERQWREEVKQKGMDALSKHDKTFDELGLPTSLDPTALTHFTNVEYRPGTVWSA